MQAPRLLRRSWHGIARGARRMPGFLAKVLLAVGLASGPGLACALPAELEGEQSATFQLAPSGMIAAWYEDETTRYAHAVLGDAIEYGQLAVHLPGRSGECATQRVTLAPEHVFEDLAPRLADLDQDGHPEVITMRSHERRGAQLAVYGLGPDGQLSLVAETPYIGQRFRWRAVVGIADLDGDGAIEIAEIDRPHLAKTMHVWRFAKGALTRVASLPGLTNHRIGQDFITGGLRDCGTGVEMIVADAPWRQVMAVRFDGTVLDVRALGPFSAQGVAAALACR